MKILKRKNYFILVDNDGFCPNATFRSPDHAIIWAINQGYTLEKRLHTMLPYMDRKIYDAVMEGREQSLKHSLFF